MGSDWRKFSSKASAEYAKNNFASEKVVEMYKSCTRIFNLI